MWFPRRDDLYEAKDDVIACTNTICYKCGIEVDWSDKDIADIEHCSEERIEKTKKKRKRESRKRDGREKAREREEEDKKIEQKRKEEDEKDKAKREKEEKRRNY